MSQFFSVKEVAGRTGVSEAIVRGWIRDGLLPHYRLGAKGRRGKIAVAAEDLDSLLASFRVDLKPAPKPAVKPSPVSRKPVLKHIRLS